MSHFLQMHYLTVYPPSNPNRDDSGRPKMVVYGGVQRLRISSQALKRAVRTSDVMRSTLSGKMGFRSRRFGEEVLRQLKAEGADPDQAHAIAVRIASIFGHLDARSEKARIAQLSFISPEERNAALELATRTLKGDGIEEAARELGQHVLRTADSSVDLAMFGRMLADAPRYNRQAAVQVAHALTTHASHAEEDYISGVDDLAPPGDQAGAGFVGVGGYGSGVFYLYVAVEVSRLIANLDGDRDLAQHAVSALVRAFALESPSGKRSAFAHNVRASFIRAEGGSVQPRSLASAFLNPVSGDDLLRASIERLRQASGELDKAYGPAADHVVEMDVAAGLGTLEEIAEFAAGQVQHG